jgi:hypothetical protein
LRALPEKERAMKCYLLHQKEESKKNQKKKEDNQSVYNNSISLP